jgi:glycosyltransferase involved in cell wall biosynthesis
MKSLRLMVIGHSYVTPFAQGKYVAMKRLNPGLALRLVTPRTIAHPFMTYRHERHPGLASEEAVVIRTIAGRTHMTYVLDPLRLIAEIRAFRPSHIHIEEDPHSLIGIETVCLAGIWCPRAQISFFIWDNLARRPRFPMTGLKWVFTRIALARAQLVVCGNLEGERLLRSVKAYRGRTAVLPQLGLDLANYLQPALPEIRAQFPLVDGEPWIGFVGRFVPEKGLRILLEALVQLRDLKWRLLLLGDGPLWEEVQTHWQPKFGARMVCLRAVPHAQLPEYLKCLDIFVLPSYSTVQWKEQFGLTLAQAMMAGVACVGTKSGAIPEVLGLGGRLVAEQDVASLKEALTELLGSPALRTALKERAKAIARARFDQEVVAGRYLELWTQD